jgi:hypothetical protein
MPVGLCVVLPPATLPVGKPLAVGAVTQSVATLDVVLPAAVLLPMVVVLAQSPTFAAAPVPGKRVLGKPGVVAPMLPVVAALPELIEPLLDEFKLPFVDELVLPLTDEPLPPFIDELGDEVTPLLGAPGWPRLLLPVPAMPADPAVPPPVAAPALPPAAPCAKAAPLANAIATPVTTPRIECFMRTSCET